ncbi:MAG: DNRLRE domain-containing protein [Anaerolineae bacterium]|nr:DNRLRE domain-containing protein [Anaerolineae bacterium]
MKKGLFPIRAAVLLVGLSGGFVAQGTVSERNALGLLADQTHVFQQGLDGYTGASDTWISTQDWGDPDQYTCNYGQNEDLTLERNGRNNPLLHFDLSSIPSNSSVVSATLSLYNTTSSALPRYVQAFRVLLEWEEGNLVNAPILAHGNYGATGDYTVQYYAGEGIDVPWSARGMEEGTDYVATPADTVDVEGVGWYTWDVSDLVRAWVHGDYANYGLTLRDASGYQVGNADWRDFVSSQGVNADQRPKLTVVYNADTPYADAGPDQENLTWDGSAITLDGSASYNPGGGGLTYAWRVVQPGYGSAITGTIGTAETIAFTPDVAGEWEFELTVTNDQDESAADRVLVRLLSIPAGHPRIYLTPQKLASLQARAVPTNTRWTQLLYRADHYDEMIPKALVSQITEQASYCEDAIDLALDTAATTASASGAGDVALVYDWCHTRLTAGEITTFVDFFNTWGDDQLADPGYTDVPGLGNYWPRYGYSFGLMGLASYGDNSRAQEWMDEFRYRRYRDVDLPWLDRIAAGGGWPEGMIYDWIANMWRVEMIEGWRSATGEDLFGSTPWFRERLGYILMHRWPGLQDQWGYEYHPYVSTGDTERNRGSMANYERIMALILIERYPDEVLARQLQAYLAAPPANGSMSFLYAREFLWFNPDQPTALPAPLTHYAAGTGTVFMRSGWPDGAADLDASVTYVTFQCGDFFTYHQHYDQNSFTIFKHDDLALDSGVYSGDGRSYHDINYYVRTIAHNSLVVYNPAEDFSAARPDASSTDGGQRTMSPASRMPPTVDYFDQYATQYDTGDVLHFEDTARYTYILGDATGAYNNPTYNQAMDTSLSGNVAKVTRFQREFVYLRPEAGAAQSNDYVVAFDRVGVTSPAFSGSNTKLLFHVMNEPSVSGTPTPVSSGETLYADATLATAINGDGKLFIRPMLPAQRNLRVVGGRGQKAFWVFGENYDWHWSSGEPQPRPTTEFDPLPYGEWRLELEPADTTLDHHFLTVLYPTISTTVAMPATHLISTTQLSGAHISDPDLNRVVLFSSALDGSPPSGALQYSYTPTTQTLNIIFDLSPGASYALTVTEESFTHFVTLTPGNGDVTVYASSQGVMSFVVEASGTIQDWPKVHLPLVLRED